MDVVYNKESVAYLGNDVENPSRLSGLERIGRLVEPELDPDSLIALVHSKRHTRKLEHACFYRHNVAEVNTDDFTYEAARKAVATSVYAAVHGNFAAVRPPGHHASKDVAAGFCFFNNMAVAAKYLINEGERVCILDIDGHHGDGTARVFRNSKDVLIWSIFRKQSYFEAMNGPNPMCHELVSSRGPDTFSGRVYPVPLRPGSGDSEFLERFSGFRPIIANFNPSVIGISAGFDALEGDRLLDLKFTIDGYRQFGRMVNRLGVKAFGVLEGGYHGHVVECISALSEEIS